MKSTPGAGARTDSIISHLGRIAASAWFAYGSILLIQAKVLWEIWRYRDLSAGDTSNYFVNAAGWTDHRWVDPLFSPLYTSYWGSLKIFIDDIYAVTIVHRVIIVFAVTLLVLAVFRRLLSPGIAWLMALWWAIQPLNYDTLNEVHLFSLIPVLVAALVALRYSGPRMRAAVFGILLGGAVLQRNELVIAAFVWLAVWVGYEWWARRRSRREGESPTPLPRIAVPLVVATLAVTLLGLLSISRSPEELTVGGWVDRARYKQDFALCQHYAVGYQQRHHADGAIGWRNCQMFMRRDFGSETPSFTEALTSNPSAMGTHFRWNLELSPYAVQLALFDRTSGSPDHNPDYVPVTTGSRLALVATVAVFGLVVLGLGLLWRGRREWWRGWLRERAWGWALLGSVAALGVWVAITTHPRPSYLLPLNFAVLAVFGMAAMVIAERWQIGRARAALPLFAVLLLALVPSHYQPDYSNPLYGPGKGASEMVSRLEPHREQLAGGDTVLLGPYAFEACNYVVPENPCTGSTVGLLGPPGVGAREWLDQNGIDLIYADETLAGNKSTREALEDLQRKGWRRIGPDPSDSQNWLLLERDQPAPDTRPQ